MKIIMAIIMKNNGIIENNEIMWNEIIKKIMK